MRFATYFVGICERDSWNSYYLVKRLLFWRKYTAYTSISLYLRISLLRSTAHPEALCACMLIHNLETANKPYHSKYPPPAKKKSSLENHSTQDILWFPDSSNNHHWSKLDVFPTKEVEFILLHHSIQMFLFIRQKNTWEARCKYCGWWALVLLSNIAPATDSKRQIVYICIST